jgi:hypothetical protein
MAAVETAPRIHKEIYGLKPGVIHKGKNRKISFFV